LPAYIVRYGGDPEHLPQEWLDALPVPQPTNPNFIQLAPLVAYGQHAPGYNKTCPRDGKMSCSIVDGVRNQRCSSKATMFLSWVWTYGLSIPLEALRSWAACHPGIAGTTAVWWCFFCNNQFRILQDQQKIATVDLADAFGKNLEAVGRMWMLFNKLDDPTYLSRIWCIFEVFVAVDKDIPCEILMPPHTEEIRQSSQSITTISELFKICHVNAEGAQATMPEDEAGIKALIREKSTFAQVNGKVEEKLHAVVLQLLRETPDPDLENGETSSRMRSL